MNDQKPAAENKKSNAWMVRLVLWLILLGVAVGALVFDQRARRQSQQAVDTLDALIVEQNKSPGEEKFARPALVQETLGMPPAEPLHAVGDHYQAEVYRWQSGLPWRTYFIQAIYTKGDKARLVDSSLNKLLTATELPTVVVPDSGETSAGNPSKQPQPRENAAEPEENEPASDPTEINEESPPANAKEPADEPTEPTDADEEPEPNLDDLFGSFPEEQE